MQVTGPRLHLQRPTQTPARCMFAVVRPDHSRPLAANAVMLRVQRRGGWTLLKFSVVT